MNAQKNELTRKYSLLLCTFWISHCIINGFATVYLRFYNFSTTTIGILLALASICSVIFQPFLASFVDKSKKITLRHVVLIMAYLVFLFGVILYFTDTKRILIPVLFTLINGFQCILITFHNSLAMNYVDSGIPVNFGLARGLSSLTYAITSTIIGTVLCSHTPKILIPLFLLPYIFYIYSIHHYKLNKKNTTNIISSSNKDHIEKSVINGISSEQQESPSSLAVFMKNNPKFLYFLGGCILLFFSHNSIGTYMIRIIEAVGGTNKELGSALSIAALVELPIMAGFGLFYGKISCTRLLKISSLAFFAKALLTFIAPNTHIIYLAQSLQSLSFALFTPASVYYVNSVISGRDKIKGQSLLGISIMGIAGTLANIISGRILDTLGVSSMLFIGCISAGIGCFIIFITMRKSETI